MLHRFGYTGIPAYRGRPYCQFGLGHCKVHVDILARELPALRGHIDGPSPTPPPGGVRRPGEGPESRRQGHSEGQLRASSEERPP
jgi:hypothetical protein